MNIHLTKLLLLMLGNKGIGRISHGRLCCGTPESVHYLLIDWTILHRALSGIFQRPTCISTDNYLEQTLSAVEWAVKDVKLHYTK